MKVEKLITFAERGLRGILINKIKSEKGWKSGGGSAK